MPRRSMMVMHGWMEISNDACDLTKFMTVSMSGKASLASIHATAPHHDTASVVLVS